MKKALVVATVFDFLRFEVNDIQILNELGYQVYTATNMENAEETEILKGLEVREIHIAFQRSPFAVANKQAYKELKKLMGEEQFDLVHCHTPVGGVLGRMAAHSVYRGRVPVLYTAHGFHFYKGAPLKNWLLFYPVEYWLAKYTDVLITINREDYHRARKKLCAGKVEYIPGIGLDIEKFELRDGRKVQKRSELGVPEDALVFLSVGELNTNKNHLTAIRAFAKLRNDSAWYWIVGKGDLEEELKREAERLQIMDRMLFLGYRKDVLELYQASDVFVFPSFREGLSVSLMEAMAGGLPVICSKIRGNEDLVDENGGKCLCPDDLNGFAESMRHLAEKRMIREKMGLYNQKKIQKFDKRNVTEIMRAIYHLH